MKRWFKYQILTIIFGLCLITTPAKAQANQFVVSYVSNDLSATPKRLMNALNVAMHQLSSKRLEIIVVAHFDAVQAMRVQDDEASVWVKKLQKQGVKFRVGRHSMTTWGLTDDDMLLSVEIVPSGLAEVMHLQMKGYQLIQL